MSVAATSLDNFENVQQSFSFVRDGSCWQEEGYILRLNAISKPRMGCKRQGKARTARVLLIINVRQDKSFFFCRV